ncbi:MAG: hypothetical protein RIQ52_1759 [Pseudomonadota bacterium]|jgi:cytochrome c oxidase assembly protein subunit 15
MQLPRAHVIRFIRLGTLTVAAVYFLILVGGIVRASGAGMGCPDWPTCFGQWIPPTDVSELPSDYQKIYAARGYAETTFNPVKTWTEYVNRLTGVSIGLLIMATLARSRVFWRGDRTIVWCSLTAFLSVAFQGWLGSAVVASQLRPVMITLHMLMAFFIVCILIYAVIRAQRDQLAAIAPPSLPGYFPAVLRVAMAMTLLQIAMGTQIRETVDVLANQSHPDSRDTWRDALPMIFLVHRSFSWFVLFINLWMAWKLLLSRSIHPVFAWASHALMWPVLLGITAGIGLDRLGFPAVMQPVHLLMANLLFGSQFAAWVMLRYIRTAPAVQADTVM